MNENSIAISAPTTPENSSIHKGKSSVPNIILNTLSNSLSKWFSPSDQNGNLRRKRETEPDIELNDMTHGTGASTTTLEPPSKRFCTIPNREEIDSHPSSSRNSYLTRHFSSSTPTTTTTTGTPTRRKTLVRNSSPFNFTDQPASSSPKQPIQTAPATITIDDNGDNSTDEEIHDDDIVADSLSRDVANRKRLNIPPTARPTSRTSNLMSMRTSLAGSRNRFSANNTIGHDLTKDDDLEADSLFNGTPNESASESEDSSSRIAFTQPNRFATKRPQSSAGRINTSLVRDDEPDTNQRRLSGLFGNGSKRLRAGTSNGLMNFSAHLQTNKSLFSDKNDPKSLNNSTTSLNSLNRRQSLNASSLYGSTSALSDSRLLNTNSPFYSGRTMFGGASAYSRRAVSSQRTLRVPTQIRPSSSLSTLYSSTNSLANVDNPNTSSALSNTAKRILDLMNQCTTPLADVKKMASNTANHTPALVNHRKRFDDNDMMLNRSMRLSTPKTPYSRPSVNIARKSPPTNELQVPTMSQLLHMKKILQSNTEKVREVATASNSILNQTGEYKLPDNSNDKDNGASSSSSSARQSKIRNKITTTRASTKNVQEEYVQEVNLPNISLPAMKNLPDISLPFSKPKPTSSYDIVPAKAPEPPIASSNACSSSSASSSSTVAKPTKILSSSSKASEATTAGTATTSAMAAATTTNNATTAARTGTSQFSFSSPTQLKLPLFADKNISPINNFKFSEPINVEKGGQPMTAGPTVAPILPKTKAAEPVKQPPPPAPLKNASVLEALNIPKPAAVPQKSLSDLFKTTSKQWECSCCMIKNDDAKDKCVACETPRVTAQPASATKPIQQTVSAPLTNSFGSQFKASADTWECSACMIRNKLDAQKCVACETPKAGGTLTKSVSALPTVPSSDQGFRAIVAQQSARWECSACMTRNPANRKKCECCEQAKPGTSSESTSFSFGSSSSSSAPKFSFGVPFNEKAASTVVPISEAKSKLGDVKPTFSFGVQPNASVTDGPVNISFGDQSKAEKDKETKKSDPPATTFSFGVKSTNTSNENDTTASTKIASTPALSGFKFGEPISQIKPASVATTTTTAAPVVPSSASTAGTFGKETTTPTSGLVFGSPQSKAAVASSLPVPVVPVSVASTISFASPKSDQKLPLFGSPASKTDSPSSSNLLQTKPTFESSTPATSNVLPSSSTVAAAATTSLTVNTTTPSSSAAVPVFAFGQTQSAVKGGFSFTPAAPIVKDNKPAFPMSDFAQNQVKPAATTLSFGSSNMTATTTAAPAAVSSTFFFGRAATTVQSDTSAASSAFGTTSSSTAAFKFGANTTPSQPIASTFGTPPQLQQQQQKPAQLPVTPSFSSVPTAITSSLPTEPATSPFMFRSTTNIEPAPLAFGQLTTPSFGQPSAVTPLLGAFGAGASAMGPSITNSAAPPAFGSASPFGSSTGSATQTPSFGSTPNNGISNSFGVPSFGSPASGFGSMIHTAPSNSDEPSAKKHSPSGFGLSQPNIQKPPAFSFGDSSSGNAAKTSFAFTANATPSFNFSGSQPAQTNSAQPYKFGASSTPTGVFNFGSTEAKSPNAPFQFAGSSDVTNNPFAPQGIASNTAAQQRRKIRARRPQR